MAIVRTVGTTKKGATEKLTVLTVDFTGITTDQIQAGYMTYLVIKLQNRWRKVGVPERLSVLAKDHAPGVRYQPDAEAVVAALTPDQRKALFAKYK